MSTFKEWRRGSRLWAVSDSVWSGQDERRPKSIAPRKALQRHSRSGFFPAEHVRGISVWKWRGCLHARRHQLREELSVAAPMGSRWPPHAYLLRRFLMRRVIIRHSIDADIFRVRFECRAWHTSARSGFGRPSLHGCVQLAHESYLPRGVVPGAAVPQWLSYRHGETSKRLAGAFLAVPRRRPGRLVAAYVVVRPDRRRRIDGRRGSICLRGGSVELWATPVRPRQKDFRPERVCIRGRKRHSPTRGNGFRIPRGWGRTSASGVGGRGGFGSRVA